MVTERDASADELNRVRTQAGELFLSTHLEKHQAEKELARERIAAHREKHDNERGALETALKAEQRRLEEHRVAHSDAHKAHEALHSTAAQAHEAQHESIAKNLTEYKAQSNEWRGSLADLRATFAQAATVDQLEKSMRDSFDAVNKRIDGEREERREQQNLRAGQQRGVSQSTAIIVGAVGFVGIVLSIVVAVANIMSAAAPVVP